MGADYIPEKDGDAAGWMRAFANSLAASPATYQITPGDAAGVDVAVQAYQAALAVAIKPDTRTKPSVHVKDQMRKTAERVCRRFAMLIKHNDAISDADKVGLGINAPTRTRTNRTVPHESPLVNILRATPGEHHVHVATTLNSKRGGKPFGAFCTQVFVAVSDSQVTEPQQARLYGSFTTPSITVKHDHAQGGKYATYFARWAGRRGDVGPWSIAKSMRIAA